MIEGKIVIIGDGTVGKAMGKALGVEPLGLSDEEIKTDVVIICVPTPTGYMQDLSNVYQAISRIKEAEIIIIRSTVLPHTCNRIMEGMENPIPIYFIPEFGFEKTMDEDIANPQSMVIGYPEGSSKEQIELIINVMPKAKQIVTMPILAAEFAKYFVNIWGCSQVSLANSFYDWTRREDDIYEMAIKGASLHPNFPHWGWEIFHNGSRGYDGKCLPKDIKAAITAFHHPLWDAIDNYNEELVKKRSILTDK